jgi:catechol 2,3-dioxygenase-like lactoylglutathione lyase family enzyme
MIRNIHHIGIMVRDFERMTRFYQEAFGFELYPELTIAREKAAEIAAGEARDTRTRIAMMRAGNCYLEIMGNPNLPPRERAASPGYVQLCVDVDDIDADYARLKGLGMTFGLAAPVDFGHVKAVTGTDPEGNVIELVQTMRDWDCNLGKMLAGAD